MKRLILPVLAIVGILAYADVQGATVRRLGPPSQLGPAPVSPVPESGGTFFLLAGAFIAIAALRYKLAK